MPRQEVNTNHKRIGQVRVPPGSVCGRSLSGKPSPTIGFEKRHNKAFRIPGESDFVRATPADIPPPPAQAEIRAINSGRMAAVE
jgi:hypothetical protein